MARTLNLGRIGFKNKGAWQQIQYYENDVVSYEGSVYCCKIAHVATATITPTSTEHWDMWTDAVKGPKGDRGEKGEMVEMVKMVL